MQKDKFYRITYDNPVHDLTVKVLKEKGWEEHLEVEIVEVHSGDILELGSTMPLYVDYLESVQPGIAPVADGTYVDQFSQKFPRIDGVWYSKVSWDADAYDELVRSGDLNLVAE